jgi:hypothetical protein
LKRPVALSGSALLDIMLVIVGAELFFDGNLPRRSTRLSPAVDQFERHEAPNSNRCVLQRCAIGAGNQPLKNLARHDEPPC